MGLEVSGYVVEPDGTINKEKRVIALLPGGGYSEYAKVKKNHLILLPQDMDMAEAAGIPEAWVVAYQLLRIANVQKGDYVLVHAAASGVGTALIQLIRQYQGESICIASTDQKITFCSNLGQGTAHGVLRKDPSRNMRIMHIAKNQGCNVILDCVGSQEFDHNLHVAGMDCRWVNYGFLGGSFIGDLNLNKLMAKRINLHFSSLRNRSDDYKAKLLNDFSHDVMPKFVTKELTPVIDTIYSSVDYIKEAHHKMESDMNIGKLVIKWH